MQMIGALFATMFGGGGAAAATGAAGAAATGSSALTLLQGAGSVLSAVATIGSGAAAVARGESEALQQKFAAKDEFIQGRETSAALKAELAKTIGNQAVAFAGGGVNLGSVSVGTAKAQATKDAETELSINANESLSRSLQRQRAARIATMQGKAAGIGSLFSAASGLAKFGMDVAERG